MCRIGQLSLLATLVIGALAANATPARGDTITVRNSSGKTVTLSDFYSYAGSKCTGDKTEHLAKGDNTDDVNLLNNGKKYIDIGNDKSYTISWMVGNKEVETDVANTDNYTFYSWMLACFNSDFQGLWALGCDLNTWGDLPPEDTELSVVDGKLVDGGGQYDWLTFYDTTGSDGWIERDEDGNPTSPLLGGASVWRDITYWIEAPEPASLSLLAMGGLTLLYRRKA